MCNRHHYTQTLQVLRCSLSRLRTELCERRQSIRSPEAGLASSSQSRQRKKQPKYGEAVAHGGSFLPSILQAYLTMWSLLAVEWSFSDIFFLVDLWGISSVTEHKPFLSPASHSLASGPTAPIWGRRRQTRRGKASFRVRTRRGRCAPPAMRKKSSTDLSVHFTSSLFDIIATATKQIDRRVSTTYERVGVCS